MLELPELTLLSWLCYLLVSFSGSLCIRILNSIWRIFESHDLSCKKFIGIFIGCGYEIDEEVSDNSTDKTKSKKKREAADYLQSFFIGWLEFIAYPVCIYSDKASFIGAWLAFKTVHKSSYAQGINRGFYNRYLISNALVLKPA